MDIRRIFAAKYETNQIMYMKKYLLASLTLCFAAAVGAHTEATDSLAPQHELTELVVQGDMKQFGTLEQQPVSAQKLRVEAMQRQGIESMKGMAHFVPNLFYPEYGSRLTSAIYIRGIGSRANTPVVGIYVDDVGLMEKSSFDFALCDAQRIEVLRGPQSTLYGRNAMGGLLKVYTPTPLQEGTSTLLRVSTSTEDAMRNIYLHHSQVLNDGLGFSLSAFSRSDKGYNRNMWLDRRSNGSDAYGGKFRLTYRNTPAFSLDFQTSAEHSDEDAYDYYNVANDSIQSGELGRYRRTLVNSSLKMETRQRLFTLTSVTAYQYLKDRMFMDQDYSPADIFTLEQRQRSHSLSEELVAKGNSLDWLEWTAGAYVAWQWLKTTAPATFGTDGISSLIQSGIDQGFSAANKAMNPMGMSLALNVTDENLVVGGDFDTPVFNAAAFGQVRFKDILTRGFDITAGLRLDYEHRSMDYLADAAINSNFVMRRSSMPTPMVDQSFTTRTVYEGTMNADKIYPLPRIALSYRFDAENDNNLVYASVAEGLRSGGYNIQLFGDLIQESLKNDMMRDLAADPKLGPMMAGRMPEPAENPTANSLTVYRPEKSWTYEVGGRLSLLDRHLNLQGAVFCLQVRDQQITRFAGSSGLGRQVLNAGRSRSYGVEVGANGWLELGRGILDLTANYGFTHATFTDYDAGKMTVKDAEGQETDVAVDYDGNYLPFAPKHTLALSADYRLPVRDVTLNFGINSTGQGKTYWTEDNSVAEPFYMLLGAHVGLQYRQLTLDFWARNLTDKAYVPFYFESMSRGFAQRPRPRQFGITASMKF